MHEIKETNSDQTTTVQERMRQHQRKQHIQCIVFGESVWRSSIEINFHRFKQNKSCPSVVHLYHWRCEFTLCSCKMNDRKIDLWHCFVLTDWWCIRKQKSGQKSESTDKGCSEYWQKYLGVGRSVSVCTFVTMSVFRRHHINMYISSCQCVHVAMSCVDEPSLPEGFWTGWLSIEHPQLAWITMSVGIVSDDISTPSTTASSLGLTLSGYLHWLEQNFTLDWWS